MTDDLHVPGDGEGADDDSLAAEFALGLTPADELGPLRERLRTDAEFAAAVAAWQQRLASLADDIKPVKPPRRAHKRLNRRLFGAERRPLLQKLWVWQGISFAALGLAAWISFSDLTPDQVPTAPVYATQISNADEGLTVLAVYDPSREALVLNRTDGGARAGRVLELWAIAPDAAPVSLGVLPDVPNARVTLPEDLAEIAGTLTLAISDEPEGGSPTGAPTGEVLGAGAVSEL